MPFIKKDIFMKRFLLLSFILFCLGCSSDPTKSTLKRISEDNDPSSLKLEDGYAYVRRTFLKDGTELGIIQIRNGSSSKYWFRSHHLSDDIGGTWFSMSDGESEYMAGFFCCEAIFPGKQFENLDDLRGFIKKHHGTNP